MYVPAGTRLVYVAEWDMRALALTYVPVADILSNIANQLSNGQNMTVESNQSDVPTFYGKGTMTLHILNQQDHGGDTDGLNDIRQIIDHAFYIASDALPSSSRIVSYQLPGRGVASTGAQDAPAPTKSYCENNPSSLLCGGGPSGTTLIWAGVLGVFALGAFFVFLKA